MKLIYITILLLFTSCGANHYLKKSERALKKAIELGAEVKNDTVYTDRTFFIPQVRIDTLITAMNFTDTIRMETERIKWKVKVNTVEKEVFVDVACKPVIKTIQVPVEVIKEYSAGISVGEGIGLVIIALIIGAVLSKIFWRRSTVLKIETGKSNEPE